MTIFLTPRSLWLMLPATQGGGSDSLLQAIALLFIAGFVVWLVFFSGNGDFRSFLADLKGQPKEVKQDPFPVPIFDKSKVEVPRPPKVQRKPVTYQRTADEIDLKLDTWAKDLRQSLREVRAESSWLVEKYKDVPLKRPKPEAGKAKPAKKTVKKSTKTSPSPAKRSTKKSPTAKTTKAKPKGAASPKTKAKTATPKKTKGKK